jgi:putative iron-regulated protein
MAASLVVFTLAACSDDSDSSGPSLSDAEKAAVLESVGSDVIVPTYAVFHTNATALATALIIFETTPNDVNLAAAQDAWRNVRAPWESTESFGFGPADFGGYDANSDSWPVNVVDLETILAGAATIDQPFLDAANEDVKGMHAIEYVLFGANGTKVAADFTAKELEYLHAAGVNLETQAAGVADAWDPAGGAYATELATAGNGSAVYATQNDALQELVQGMADIADELANSKIAGVIGPPVDLTQEESAFSGNTATDFHNNMASISNVYLNAGGHGITELVADLDANLDAEVRQRITAAETAIDALAPSFSDAVTNSPALVTDAQTKVEELRVILADEVLPLVIGS